jgi:hypothetical protein
MLEELRDDGLLEPGWILDHESFAVLAPARDIGGASIDHMVRFCGGKRVSKVKKRPYVS